MTNTPNVSRNSLDYSKFYETLVLQQGVPWLDSDFNEQVDLLSLRRMMETRAKIGSALFSASPGAGRGFEVTGIPATIANADISAGYASVYGTIVPSTPNQLPLAFEYESDDNYMTDGFASSVAAGTDIVSDDKKYEGWMSLVGCRVKMTSGGESGNEFPITSVPNETTLRCSGGIGTVAATDTFIIKPPALPASVGATTTKEFQLWVFWEWINENQDPNIVNPGVAIETCERRILRWCVRAEDTPYVGTPDMWTFSLRILPIADVTIETTDTTLYPVVYEDLFADPTLGWTKHMTQTFMFETTLSGDTSFLLPKYGDINLKDPRYYYVGIGATKASYRGFFEILDASDPEKLKPIVGSDGKPIIIDGIWIGSTTEVTDPSAQASSEGFLTNADTDMEVRLDFSETSDIDYTGDIICRCYYRAPFVAQDPSNFPENGVTRGVHAEKVYVPEYDSYLALTGIQVYLPASDMDAWVDQVGLQLRSRPPVYPSSQSLTEDTWKILYSTGNLSGLDQSTIQMWWNRYGEFVTCQSCYPYTASPNTQFRVEAPSSTGTLDAGLEGWIFDSGGSHLCYVRAHKYSVSHGTVLNPLDKSDWDSYTLEARLSHETYRGSGLSTWDVHTVVDFHGSSSFWASIEALSLINLGTSFASIYDNRVASTARRLLYEWDAVSFGSVRVYLKGDSSTQHKSLLEIAINCKWEAGTSQWAFAREGLSDEASQATVYRFEATGLVALYQRDSYTTGSRWDDTTLTTDGWFSAVNLTSFGGQGQVGPIVTGAGSEIRKVALAGKNVGTGSDTLFAADAVNYANNQFRDYAEGLTSITLTTTVQSQWSLVPGISYIDQYGFIVSGISDSAGAGTAASWFGKAIIDISALY